VTRVRKAVERSTLDQPGTKSFHLKAELAPSFARDKDSGRTGEVEIWWAAPDKWRREVRSPEFHQVEIVNGPKDWQKNEGDYFPEWLRETAVALVRPVPDLDKLLKQADGGEVRDLLGTTHISWADMGSDGVVSKGIGAGISLNEDGISFVSGLGFSAGLKDFKSFHGRNIARKVTSGGFGAEVTAEVTVLEDLQDAAGLFDAGLGAGDPTLQTQVVDEVTVRKNLVPQNVSSWPPLEQGPLEGVLMADVVIDREGKVREVGSLLSDNPGLSDEARSRIQAMRFKPYMVNGLPIQVVTTITMPFKTVRPAGMETFDTAKNYFEHARKLGFPAASASAPYALKAEFTARDSTGDVAKGTYTDTWVSETQWRREADLGASRYVRSQSGDARYMLAEGPDAKLLQFVLTAAEPIPAIDSFNESDWRIKRDQIDGIATIRVARGYESPDGTPDPKQFNSYWFDGDGQLVKSYGNGLETRRTAFAVSDGVGVARRVDVLFGGKLVMRIDVTGLGPAGTVDPGLFVLKGHEWTRQFTAEVR
jgi:hypothetical protein